MFILITLAHSVTRRATIPSIDNAISHSTPCFLSKSAEGKKENFETSDVWGSVIKPITPGAPTRASGAVERTRCAYRISSGAVSCNTTTAR